VKNQEPDPKDPFSRVNYRSLIAWPARIQREAPFLARALADLPDRSIADLGCGTGEHSRHFASLGFRVAGIDASPSMIEDALDEPLPPRLTFLLGDLREADRLLGERFGGAICLGNTLPMLTEDEDLRRALEALHRLLLPGGRALLQILNYERLRARKERHLPINFRGGDDGEIVFLRLLDFRENGRVVFFPTTLRIRPDDEEPVTVERTRRVDLRAWTRAEILPALERAGFREVELHGDMVGGAFDPMESSDLVVRFRRPLD
jgi:SAM-dependent methyltransferase